MAEHTIDDLYDAVDRLAEMMAETQQRVDAMAQLLEPQPLSNAARQARWRANHNGVTKSNAGVTKSNGVEHEKVTKPVTQTVTQPSAVTASVTVEHENVTACVTNPPYIELRSSSLFPENESNGDRSLGESLREPRVSVTTSVTAVFEAYRASIQPKARLIDAAKMKIATRLRTFGELELLEAVRRFAGDNWQMEHNGWRGAAWFFDSDKRIEDYVNLPSRNGHGMTKFEHGMKVISATKPTELPDNSSNWAPTGEPNEWKLLMLQL